MSRQHRRLRVRIKRSRKAYHKVRRSDKMKTRHHDKAKSLGGTYDKGNIFILTADHHRAYHKLFGLRTFKQAAEVLMRMYEMHQKGVRCENRKDV